MNLLTETTNKIKSKKSKVAIMGLGFVGLGLAEGILAAGFKVDGIDIDKTRVVEAKKLLKKNFQGFADFSPLKTADVILICVPTPLNRNKTANLKFIKLAALKIAENLRPGQLIVTESSIPMGTTRKVLLPILEKTKLKLGKDYFLGMSPERIDPGSLKYHLRNIPKIVSGVDETSKLVATLFYGKVVQKVVPVSNVEVAELAKILENTFRFVNISLINELADYTKKKGINIREVINAAASKPFGFMPHFPSAGIGGYCIPVLPYYLLTDARSKKMPLHIIKAASKVNEKRPEQIVKRSLKLVSQKALRIRRESLSANQSNLTAAIYHAITPLNQGMQKPKLLLIGVGYKAGSSDTRYSVALKIWEIAEKYGAKVSYHDPFVSSVKKQTSTPLNKNSLSKHDLVIIANAYKDFPYQLLIDSKKPIVDTNHIMSESK